MPETHRYHATIEEDPNGGWYDIRDEWHEFVASPECDSEGLMGYVSMRCSLAYRGCDDRACVCRCHQSARTVEGEAL